MVIRACTMIVALLCCFLASGIQAAVSAQLSTSDIDELERVTLLVRVSDTRQSESLDLSVLEPQFEVLQSNTSSQYRYVNGREQSWVDYQITLQPRVTGELIVPSIKIGNESTPTLKLTVRPLSDQVRAIIDERVFFENQLSRERIYVQAELILVRRLFYGEGVQLYSDLPGAPDIENAVVLTLGETRSGTAQRRGRTYGVVEQRYAIFPERSGTLQIPGISVTASVRLNEAGRISRKGVTVSTAAEEITVDPVPAGYPADAAWLPAREVRLHQELAPEGLVNVGDTLTHELLVHIKSNVGSIASPIPLNLDDEQVRSYPQSPVIDDVTAGPQVTGARLQTTSLVPLRPGPLVLPEQTLHWWNTTTNTLQVARLPARTLNVAGTPVTQTLSGADNAPANEEDLGIEDEVLVPTTSTQTTLLERIQALPWQAIGWASAAMLLIITAWSWLRRRPRMRSRPAWKALERTTDDQAFYALLTQILGELKISPAALKTDADTGPAYEALLASIYHPDAPGLTADQRTRIVKGLRRRQNSANRSPERTALPPLYSSSG